MKSKSLILLHVLLVIMLFLPIVSAGPEGSTKEIDEQQQKFDNYINDLSSKGYPVKGLTKDNLASDSAYNPPGPDGIVTLDVRLTKTIMDINRPADSLSTDPAKIAQTQLPNQGKHTLLLAPGQEFELTPDGKINAPNGAIMDGIKYDVVKDAEFNPDGSIKSGTFVEASAPASPASPGSSGESGSGGSSPMQVTEPRDASFSESSYTVGSASSFRQGDMFLTNAQGLVGTVDSTCGSVADSMIVKSIMQSGVSDFCIKGDSVEVGHAEQVQIKCDGDGRTLAVNLII
jgi:hypothetical protein